MINGILNIYKEKGYTSHDVVARLRGIVGQKKIGHTGTLDPDAEGVLPVCLGRATKVCDLLTDKDKTYEAVLLLGKSTDTQDISGTVLEEKSTGGITEEMTEACVRSFIGDYDQIPPMYSALKVGGKKLYELAREGKTVERKSRRVTIYDIRIKETVLPRIRMEVDCSKGTYIRTLCHDIGEKLGTGGCMESLLRTKAGMFSIGESLRLDQVEATVKAGKLSDILRPVDCVFQDLEPLRVRPEAESLARNGNPLTHCQVRSGVHPGVHSEIDPGIDPGELQEDRKPSGEHSGKYTGRYRVYDTEGNFIGIYSYDGERHLFRPEKMFLL